MATDMAKSLTSGFSYPTVSQIVSRIKSEVKTEMFCLYKGACLIQAAGEPEAILDSLKNLLEIRLDSKMIGQDTKYQLTNQTYMFSYF